MTALDLQKTRHGAPLDPEPARRRVRLDHVLDGACEVINACGVTARPLATVAERLGLTRAALYYYVRDREDLVFQVYMRTCELLLRALDAAEAGGGDALEMIRRFVATALDPDGPSLSALNEVGLLREDDRRVLTDTFGRLIRRLADRLAAGAAAGQVRACDFDAAARTVVSLVTAIPPQEVWEADLARSAQADRRLKIEIANDLLTQGWAVDRSTVMNVAPVDLSPYVPTRVQAFDREGLAEARREAILLAATGLFNRKGVDSTTLDEIAAAVGSTKRTLYQYVGDKQAIIAACSLRSVRILRHMFEEALAAGVPPDAATVIRWQMSVALAYLRRDIEPMGTTFPREGEDLSPVAGAPRSAQDPAERFWAAMHEQTEHSAELLRALQETGVLRRFGPDGRALPFGHLGRSLLWLRGRPGGDDPAGQLRLAREVVDLMRLGLKPLP